MDSDELRSSEVLLLEILTEILGDSPAFVQKICCCTLHVSCMRKDRGDRLDDELCRDVRNWHVTYESLDLGFGTCVNFVGLLRYFIEPSCRQSFLSVHCCN